MSGLFVIGGALVGYALAKGSAVEPAWFFLLAPAALALAFATGIEYTRSVGG